MIEIFINNFKLVNPTNSYEHWTKRKKRVDKEKLLILAYVKPWIEKAPLPVSIKLIRIAPRFFDESDNLRASFKSVKDAISSLYFPEMLSGRADELPCFEWKYDQQKGNPKEYGVKIILQSNVSMKKLESIQEICKKIK